MQAESLGDILARVKAGRRAPRAEHDLPQDAPAPASITKTCSICRGLGWLSPAYVGPADRLSAQITPCSCQAAATSADRLKRLRSYSNLGTLSRYTFESLDHQRIVDATDASLFLNAFTEAVTFTDNPRGWLVLTGPPTTGKTHLAASIVNALIERDREVLYMSLPDLLDELRSGFNPNNPLPYVEIYDRVSDAKVLVLDDLGQHYPTEWAQEKLHQIVNHRYNAQLPTVFVVDGPISQLDPLIASRLQDDENVTIAETALPRVPAGDLWLPPSSVLTRMTFDSFRVFGSGVERHQRKQAIEAAKLFARTPQGWLIFSGPTGVGKTHLAVAITRALLPHSRIMYARVQQLLHRLQSTFGETREGNSFYSLITQLSGVDVLVLDNLGSENNTQWNRATLEDLLVARHDSRLPTVVTTSYDLSEEIGPVASRLNDATFSTVVSLTGDDLRRRPIEDWVS